MSWPDFSDPAALFWLLLLGPCLWAAACSLADRPPLLRWCAFGLRALGMILIAAGAARPFLRQPNSAAHLNVLLDVSASAHLDGIGTALDQIEKAVAVLRPGDSFSLHLLGDGLRETTVPAARETLARWRSGGGDDPFRSRSRIASGILASRLSFPGGKAKRVILMSDGVETEGGVGEALAALQREGADVRFQKIAALQEPEASVMSLESPSAHAFEGETVRLTARLRANSTMRARARLVSRGVVMAEKPVDLAAGRDLPVTFDTPMTISGDSVWSVEIVPEKDRFPVNNRAETVIQVRGRPRILLLHDEPRDMRAFVQAVRGQQLDVDARGRRGLPASLSELGAFDAIILSNIAASDLSPAQMEMLRRYVSDLGGGLAMLGSENSFGLGGYYKTPVEEVLPLVSRFEKEKEKPSLALALVIDKSGSMEGLPIELARQAAKLAAEILTSRDQAAVIGFDSQPQVLCEMTYASDLGTIQAAVDSLAAGGGTDVFPAMERAGEMLRNASAKVKHMIVLTDGQTQEADFPGLVQRLVDEGVTISAVALGDGAARELLSTIAENGRGRYYETADPANMPQIFTRETMQASRTAIQEDIFTPAIALDHPLLAGVKEEALPAALGYVMTQAKPTAQTLLSLETGDPLLAVSRFGLGTGLCYTSDLTDKWGAEWLGWEGFGAFWAQLLRGVMRKADVEGVQVRSTIERGVWRLRMECADEAGAAVPGVVWNAATASEQGATAALRVRETGLGVYEAEILLQDASPLAVRLHDTTRNKLVLRHHRPAYPAEYQLGLEAAPELAALPAPDFGAPASGLAPGEAPRAVHAWFYLFGLAFLLGGILLRRL